MTKQYITLVAPEDVMTQLMEGGILEGVELGKSRPADSLTDGFDAPLGPEEVKAILQVATVAFGTGSAAIVFFEKLRKLLQELGKKTPVPVVVKEGRTGKRIANFDQNSDPEELSRKVYK